MIRRKKSRAKKNLSLFLLAFFIPVLIMIGIFYANEIYPFGDNCFLRTDLYHQYAMFFSELQDKLQNGGSLLYSWNIGAGTNFLTLYGYYLASPFNWLTVFIAKEYLIEWISCLVIVKIGLCSLSFTWYLHRKFHSNSYILPLFGFAYALSAYMAAYSWNIMWLDCLVLAPLILLGLEALVKEEKGLLYCLSLALCILTNYYISIMVCLFLVFYFLVLLVELSPTEKQRRCADGSLKTITLRPRYFRALLQFGLYSLIAGGISAVLLIPEILMLSSTASGSTTFPSTLTNYFSVLEMLARHCVNVTVEIGLEHWPNIYCGCAILFLFPLYLFSRGIPAREKIAKCLLLAFLLFSFSYNIPNYIWHGFHYPNSLPCRQSFLYIAVLLTMCCEAVLKVRHQPVRSLTRSIWAAILFLVLCDYLIDVSDFSDYTFWLTFVFMGLCALFLWLHRTGRAPAVALLLLSFALLITELSVNTYTTSVTTVSRSNYWKYYEDYQSLIAEMDEEESLFYRAEKDSTTRRSKDDGAWLLYRSASVFSSVANSNVTALYKTFGLEASTNAYSTNGLTPVTASLLGIRYLFSYTSDDSSVFYEYYDSSSSIYAYENPYALSLGYMISSSAFASLASLSGDPIEMQNAFLLETTGTGDVFEELTGSLSGAVYLATVTESGYYYAYITNTSVDTVTVTIAGTSKTFSNVKRGYLLDLGYCEAGVQIAMANADSLTVTATVYRLNEENLDIALTTLATQQWELLEFEDTHVSGEVTATADGYLFVTIPYESGWTVRVDGEIVACETYMDAFFAVPVSAGTHTVTFDFEPAGFRIGTLISLCSVLALLALKLAPRFSRRKMHRSPVTLTAPPLPPRSEIPTDELDHVITIDDLPEED